MLAKLAKLADTLDSAGLIEEAGIVDNILKKIAEDLAFEKVKKLASAGLEWLDQLEGSFQRLKTEKDTAKFATEATELRGKIERQVVALHQAAGA
jgi:hypothetical protein